MPNESSYNPDANHAVTIRTPRWTQDAAKDALHQRGWGVREFFTACLLAAADNPDAVLAHVQAHRVKSRRPGRPRKTTSPAPEAGDSPDVS